MPDRSAAWAGMFYEGQPDALRAQIRDCFLGALGPGREPVVDPAGPRRIAGLVVPHAGLKYSGYAAAHAYLRLAEDGPVDVVAILGPNHRAPAAADTALWASGEWETPLGSVPVAEELAGALLARCPSVMDASAPHLQEHSIEVQLPFLQILYGDAFSLLPIAMKRYSLDGSLALGQGLAEVLAGRNAVVIASSDFSHYETARHAREQDRYALAAIEGRDPAALFARVRERDITLCGHGPVAAMLEFARQRGATQAETLAYTNSGDITGDETQVVGYAAVVVSSTAPSRT